MIMPKSLHFVGIAGIGMSGVAQAAASLGIRVTGSDRAIHAPENKKILDSLRKQGIVLYEQDGSVYKDYTPEMLVFSTAVEEGNPDFRPDVARLHRSEAVTLLVELMKGKKLHAVAGTCGKTTVSGWLTAALSHLSADPVSLCGGLMNEFSDETYCGNFRNGTGDAFVLEADESDKSLLNYTPDSAILLNIGDDHYSREEVADVFATFLKKVKGPCVIEDRAFQEIGAERLRGCQIYLVSSDADAPSEIAGYPVRKLENVSAKNGGFYCKFSGIGDEFLLPVPGVHSALNALAVFTLLTALGYDEGASLEAIRHFSGVWRRFDFCGTFPTGAKVYDDYAHNPDKIRSAVMTAQVLAGEGKVHAVFQPHGFKPMRMMRDELFAILEDILRPGDSFSFLPVFYAGGTAAFTPTSEEVIADYNTRTIREGKYGYYAARPDAKIALEKTADRDDLILILGARDNSLSLWAKELGGSI
ncbi:MAG: hypothetical protein IKB16_00435 [Lentisphaeria bacterium]|nr:hypothetical protein [Lentisphaeria bacterium]